MRKKIFCLFLSVFLFCQPFHVSAVERRSRSTTTITISFAGDCTLGYDDSFGMWSSFVEIYQIQQSYSYFLENVQHIFSESDITVVNLETTLTNATAKAEKQFTFRGPPEFANILTAGSVDAVNIANNHIMDYFQRGFDETLESLTNVGVEYFGLGNYCIIEKKGIKAAFLGYNGWSSAQSAKNQVQSDINLMRAEGAGLVFVYFHWGAENVNYPNQTQIELGRFAIDAGADMVCGAHPHVMQSIEEYNGKYIVYSLGNFAYGGHKNPADKDTLILQYYATYKNDGNGNAIGEKISDGIKIIPCLLSSIKERNDYRPTPAQGDDFDRIVKRLNEFSKQTNTVLDGSLFYTPTKKLSNIGKTLRKVIRIELIK